MSGRLPYPTLMLVTERHRSATPLTEAVRVAVSAGVDLVQFREPDLSDEETERLAGQLIETVGVERLVLNGRPELARRLGLGLHLRDGQGIDQPGTGALLGQSIHGTGPQRPDARLDYVVAGNVFATRTHPGRPGRGIGWLTGLVERAACPVLGIGGITAGNATEAMRSGCHGVAAIDAILADPDPGGATAALRRTLDRAVHDGQVIAGRTHRSTIGEEMTT